MTAVDDLCRKSFNIDRDLAGKCSGTCPGPDSMDSNLDISNDGRKEMWLQGHVERRAGAKHVKSANSSLMNDLDIDGLVYKQRGPTEDIARTMATLATTMLSRHRADPACANTLQIQAQVPICLLSIDMCVPAIYGRSYLAFDDAANERKRRPQEKARVSATVTRSVTRDVFCVANKHVGATRCAPPHPLFLLSATAALERLLTPTGIVCAPIVHNRFVRVQRRARCSNTANSACHGCAADPLCTLRWQLLPPGACKHRTSHRSLRPARYSPRLHDAQRVYVL